MDIWTEYVLQISKDLLVENNVFSQDIQNEFIDISNYCRGTCLNPLGKDRMETNPEYLFTYDIIKWLSDKNDNLFLKDCKFSSSCKMTFTLTNEQFQIMNDTLERYTDTIIGKSKVLDMVSQQTLWRIPKIYPN